MLGQVIGGAGDDTCYISDASLVIVEHATVGEIDSRHSEVSCQLPDNIETLTLLTAANLNGAGNCGANSLNGNLGDIRLIGLGGADVIDGGSGDDRLIGGAQNDTLDGGDGDDVQNGQARADRLTAVSVTICRTAVPARMR